METTSNSSDTVGGSIIDLVETSQSEITQHVEKVGLFSNIPKASRSSAKATNNKSIVPSKIVNATYQYEYEIDCEKVADSINVIDLVS